MATPDTLDVCPVTLGARDVLKCRVRFAVGDALSLLASPRSARDDVGVTPTGGDGENSDERSGFSPYPEPTKPPGSFFSGLTCLVDDRAWFPVRILRGVGPRGRATGEGLPPRLSGFGIGDSKNTRSPSPPSELLRLERGCDPGDRRPTRGEGGW